MGGSQRLNLPGGGIALLCGGVAGGGIGGERTGTSPTVVSGHVLSGRR